MSCEGSELPHGRGTSQWLREGGEKERLSCWEALQLEREEVEGTGNLLYGDGPPAPGLTEVL